jgi:hypothetical protein
MRKAQRSGRRIFLLVDLFLAVGVGNYTGFEPRRYKKMTRGIRVIRYVR